MSEGESQPPILAIVTQLTGASPTGVEAHFRLVERLAAAEGYEVVRIHPHGQRSLEILVLRLLNRLALTLNFRRPAYRLRRGIARRAIGRRLRELANEADGRRLTLYAQDSLSSALAAKECGTKGARVVTVVHFNHSEGEELVAKRLADEGDALWRRMRRDEASSLTGADAIIFVSDYMRRCVLARHGPEIAAKAQIIFNAPEFAIEFSTGLPERDLIAIGTLEPRKNQGFLLEIVAACAAAGHRFTLTIVGEGPDRAMLEAKARALGISGAVKFAGHVPNAQSLLPYHRALIHTASIENLPITLVEALAHSRPVFALSVGGIPEIVRDGREGLFLDEGDAVASAHRLAAALVDKGRVGEMGLAARRRYEDVFTAERFWRELRPVLFPEHASDQM